MNHKIDTFRVLWASDTKLCSFSYSGTSRLDTIEGLIKWAYQRSVSKKDIREFLEATHSKGGERASTDLVQGQKLSIVESK